MAPPGRRVWNLVVLVAALVEVGCLADAPPGEGPPAGVVVVEVKPGALAAGAGLEAGDVISGWKRGRHGDRLASPLELELVGVEEAPRGPVELDGSRAGAPVRFELAEGSWGLTTCPLLDGAAAQALTAALAAAGSDRAERLRALAAGEERSAVHTWLLVTAAEAAGLDGGAQVWAQAIEVGDDTAAQAWAHERHGKALQAAGRPVDAAAAHSRALELRQRLAPRSLAVASSLNTLGALAFDRGDLDTADQRYRGALEIRERLAPGSLAVAASHNNLGNVAEGRGDLDAAETHHRQALDIKERLAPGTMTVAASLTNLGNVCYARGRLEDAEALLRRALEITDRLAPGSLNVATALNSIGLVVSDRGDLDAAESYYRRALEITERLQPESLAAATCIHNLGSTAWSRGDLDTADRRYRHALEIRERLAPDSLDVAATLNNLGTLALGRGELDSAEAYYRRALEVSGRVAPDSPVVAIALSNLGSVASERGDLEAAEAYYRRTLELRERQSPDSLAVATSLKDLGGVAADRGDPAAAEAFCRRALELQERLAPGSLPVAATLLELGKAAYQRGDQQTAERHLRRALEIGERLAPGSSQQARSQDMLARVLRARGRDQEALEAMERAVAALEAQQTRLGGTAEQLGEFRAQYLDIYRNLVDLLLDLGRAEAAFGVVERSQARALLAMLAERDLSLGGVPAELERERRLANAEHDRTLAALGELSAADEDQRQRLLAALDAVRRRQEEIRARVRAASPRLAELRYPEPLDLAGTRALLDPGTLLLEYSLGRDSGYLFAVGPGPERFSVYPLDLGEAELRERVASSRALAEGRGRLSRSRKAEEDLKTLSATLLGPASAVLAACSRVVVVPDGPLHLVAFAALLDPTTDYRRYLVEARPLSVVASATVLGQLMRERRERPAARVVAFGDPVYPAPGPMAEKRAPLGGLERLPGTRPEVEAIGELYGDRATLWLGAEATEERAKSEVGTATVVIFAVHGTLDERRPLSSALALAVPEHPVEGGENGLLQAWEVLEQVRLDADLVVLSACETARGKEVAGEGILGLTRAFQYAGARTVLASLWRVSDESTATLMRRFHANFAAGMAKDEALRAAQLAFIRGDADAHRDLSLPYYWAAFQLYGDGQ